MLQHKYDDILKQFEYGYSHFFGKAVDWWPSGRSCITVKLQDGQLMEYNSIGDTIRYVKTDEYTEDVLSLRKEIGRNIQKVIMTRGLPQSEIASKCGITEAMLSRYIHGTSLPGVDKLCILARVLDCRISELTGEID
jgi:predicted XRE-type DNA-binding protein